MKIRRSELRVVEEALQMAPGTISNFSNRTFAEFFEDEFDIEIYDSRYAGKGDSKANRLRAFVEAEDAGLAVKVLRRLLDRERTIKVMPWIDSPADRTSKLDAMHELLVRIETAQPRASTEGIERFERSETLDELVGAISRDIDADRPEAALGHLHTYCMKRFGHLLDLRGIFWDRKEPLHARVGKYRQALDAEMSTHEMTRQIVGNSIAVFEKFNDVRNNRSLAHDTGPSGPTGSSRCSGTMRREANDPVNHLPAEWRGSGGQAAGGWRVPLAQGAGRRSAPERGAAFVNGHPSRHSDDLMPWRFKPAANNLAAVA